MFQAGTDWMSNLAVVVLLKRRASAFYQDPDYVGRFSMSFWLWEM